MEEPVVITAYHRKSVLRALNRKRTPADADPNEGGHQRHHRSRYGPEVMEALVPASLGGQRSALRQAHAGAAAGVPGAPQG